MLTPRCQLIVFLNKFDLLVEKLSMGVKINKYLPSFAERENSAPVLARCKLPGLHIICLSA